MDGARYPWVNLQFGFLVFPDGCGFGVLWFWVGGEKTSSAERALLALCGGPVAACVCVCVCVGPRGASCLLVPTLVPSASTALGRTTPLLRPPLVDVLFDLPINVDGKLLSLWLPGRKGLLGVPSQGLGCRPAFFSPVWLLLFHFRLPGESKTCGCY